MRAPPSTVGEPLVRARPVRRIACVLVSWNDAADLENAVRSLASARSGASALDARVTSSLVVVGNGGGAASVRRSAVESLWPGARVIENAENRGLGPAANQGAAAAGDVDALLFCNPDSRADGDVFTAIANGFDARPEAVALAPRLEDAEKTEEAEDDEPSASPARMTHGGEPGKARPLAPPGAEDQRTFQLRRLPRLASDVRELLLWDHLRPNGRSRRWSRYADADREKPFPVEQAAGAVFAVRADAFARIGGFDEDFVPAWFEDVDLCARLDRIGSIVYWPEARFRHEGGASSRRLGYDRFLPILYENALRYRRKHYGVAARAVYRIALAAGMTLRLGLLPLRPHVPRPRPEAARAYRTVLARALGLRRAPELGGLGGEVS